MAGRPMAASSATVEAPDRDTTRWLAAMRAGITTVIIPKQNEKDLVDIPEEAKQKIVFVPVETVDEVLKTALEQPPSPYEA